MNKNVASRIENAPACEVIRLTDREKDIYSASDSGGRRMLARFGGGELVELYNPWDSVGRDGVQGMLDRLRGWIGSATGEIYLVMCSCYELCEPRSISTSSARDIAHVSKIFGDSDGA